MKENTEWKEFKLKEIADYINKKVDIDFLTKRNYISTENLLPNIGGIIESNTLPAVKKVNSFKEKDILFSNIRTYFKKIWLANTFGGASNDVLIIRSKDLKIALNEYLYYSLAQNKFFVYTVQTSKGTKMPRGDKEAIMNYAIKVPKDIEEQQNIVSILKSLDDKIELNNKMNETLEEMAQTIFKEWFVNFNFPNEEGKPYKDNGGKMVESELGMIPEGWKVDELKGLGEIITGKTPNTKKKENYGGVYPFITIPDMHGKTFISETERSLSEEGNKVQAKKLLPINSVIVSCIATVGLVGINTRPSHTNQQINSIIPKKEFYLFYIYELIKNKKDLLYQLGSAGTTTLNVNKGIFEKIQVINPYEDILIQFYKAIKPIYDKVLENQSENQTLIKTRDILLPKLMSGEIRV